MGQNPSTSAPVESLSRDEARARFGAWIKAARERSGLSVDAVAQETRISKGHIASLEEGSMEALPGKVFGRGFVKNITRLLKTDSAEGLKLYDACWGQMTVTEPVQPSENAAPPAPHLTPSVKARIAEPVDLSSPVSKRLVGGDYAAAGEKPRLPGGDVSKARSFPMPSFAWLTRAVMSHQIRLWVLSSVAAVFVLLVFGRWAAGTWHKARLDSERAAAKVAAVPAVAERSMNEKSATQSQEAEAIATAAAAVQPTPDATPAMKVAEAPVSQTVDTSLSGKTATRPMDNDEDNPLFAPTSSAVAFEQVIELKVTGDTEARVTLDGKKVDQTWYESNSYRFTFNERAEVYLLDASKVDLIYNGKSLGVLGNAGRRRKILFQAKASAEDFPSY